MQRTVKRDFFSKAMRRANRCTRSTIAERNYFRDIGHGYSEWDAGQIWRGAGNLRQWRRARLNSVWPCLMVYEWSISHQPSDLKIDDLSARDYCEAESLQKIINREEVK